MLLDLLPQLAQVDQPALVVDLGSGTGLSTRFWALHAQSIIGVEPVAEMIEVAVAATDSPNVSYVVASAHATGLLDGCADIVTCSQSLYWMEPEPTFAEIARILRQGGVFAAYEYRSLLTRSPEVMSAFEEVFERKTRLREQYGLDQDRQLWPISRQRLQESGQFRFTAETVLHGIEEGNADRLVGFLLSEGSMTTLLATGVTERDVGLERLREIATAELGDELSPWLLGYKVVLGWR